jgi:type I restriction enzyme S subunit
VSLCYKKFGELFDFLHKSKIKAGEGVNNGEFKFYTSSNIQKKFINLADYESNALVFGTGGSASVHFATSDFSTSTDCIVAKVKDENLILTEYCYRYLSTNIQLLEMGFRGAGLKHISKKYIEEISIPLPPLAQQKRIAAILDKADEIKRKREQAIAKLGQLAQSIFVEMFGDLANNSKGWDIGKIGDLLESATYGTSEKANSIGSYAVLRMNNITRSGAIDLKDLKYMYLEEKHLDRFLVKAGDVLFNRTNSADLVGKTAIYRMNTPVAYAGYLIRLRVNEMANGEYIAGFLNTKYAKKELRLMCKSIIGMANINAKEIQAMRIPITPIALQEQFATRISKLEKLKASNIAALAKHNQLFASLQNQAFTGQL